MREEYVSILTKKKKARLCCHDSGAGCSHYNKRHVIYVGLYVTDVTDGIGIEQRKETLDMVPAQRLTLRNLNPPLTNCFEKLKWPFMPWPFCQITATATHHCSGLRWFSLRRKSSRGLKKNWVFKVVLSRVRYYKNMHYKKTTCPKISV